MSLVSILIPAYNAEKQLGETISSALAQTWREKEIIIVDDGSRDATLSVARSFRSRSVEVVTQQNRGVCAARNRALEIAQGHYIQWLDADDLLAPDKIALQMQRREGDGDQRILFTAAWGRFFNWPHRASFVPDALWCDLSPRDWLTRSLGLGQWMNPAVWLASRELIELAGPWDERLSFSGVDDGEYLCRMVACSSAVDFVDGAACYYRVGNPSGLSWRKKGADFFLATTLSIEHLRRIEDSAETRAACLSFLQTRLCYLYPLDAETRRAAECLAKELGGALGDPKMSTRFQYLAGALGWRRAMALKLGMWRAEMQISKGLDRVAGLARGTRDRLEERTNGGRRERRETAG